MTEGRGEEGRGVIIELCATAKPRGIKCHFLTDFTIIVEMFNTNSHKFPLH